MSNMTQEDMKSLQEIADLDPEFVTAYLSTLDKEEAMPQTIQSKFYLVKEVSEMLNVCQNTVLGLIKKGKIKAIQESGGSRKWLIAESHFNEYVKSNGVELQSNPEGATNMQCTYDRATSKNVADFLTTWDKRDMNFTVQTLIRDFSPHSSEPVGEQQMNNILASLARAGILTRSMRGVYRCGHVEPKLSVPAVQVEKPEPVQVPDDNPKFKKQARLAVEQFLDRYSNDDEDFHFSIDDIAKEYPKIERKEIGKAIQNLHTWGKNSPNPNGLKIERSGAMGSYVKRGKKSATQKPDLRQALSTLNKEELIDLLAKAIKS